MRVCLIGNDIVKEKALLQSQADIHLSIITATEHEAILAEVTQINPDILVISDASSQFSADEVCLMTHVRSPDTKTLIITELEADYARLEQSDFTCRGFVQYEQRHAIVRAVRVVNDGESWLPRKLITELLDNLANTAMQSKRKPKLVKNN
ncbi:hypothetical protein [Methylophaga sp.]|uniref:hypothetical protein n=1 Tax=Methylophaga sp. TaxID=2024840 RepID=UPI003F696DCA